MSDITVQIDNSQINAELTRLSHAVSNMRPAFSEIGQLVKTNIELCFRDHKSPDGIVWDVLSPVTISKRRNGSSEPLNDTGILKNSFTYDATNNSVQIGTNVIQAAMMNFGGTKAAYPQLWGDVPARKFMPTENLPPLWTDEILAIIRQHLEL